MYFVLCIYKFYEIFAYFGYKICIQLVLLTLAVDDSPLENAIDISIRKGEMLMIFSSNIYVNFSLGIEVRESKNVTRYDFWEMKCFFQIDTRSEIDESIFYGDVFFSK